MPERVRGRRAVLVTFAVGLVALAVAVAVALGAKSPRLVRIGSPGIKAINQYGAASLQEVAVNATACQNGEVLPAGVSAIRVSIWAFFGAPLHVTVYKNLSLVTQGTSGANWTGDSVTVPVRPVAHSVSGVRTCFTIAPNDEPLLVLGNKTSQQHAAAISRSTALATGRGSATAVLMPGRMAFEYLAPGHVSWWSQILTVARHFGLGRAYSGTWIALLAATLMLAVCALALRLSWKELG